MMTSARQAAEAYVQRVRARDAKGVAGLFAEGGELASSNGRRAVGREAIAAFYEDTFARVGPVPQIVRAIGEGPVCAAELHVTAASGQVAKVIDVFELGADGFITSLNIYRQGA